MPNETTQASWDGALVKVKPEWLDKNERDMPYVVLEDRGDRVLVSALRPDVQSFFLPTWVWPKNTMYIVDAEFLSRSDAEQHTALGVC